MLKFAVNGELNHPTVFLFQWSVFNSTLLYVDRVQFVRCVSFFLAHTPTIKQSGPMIRALQMFPLYFCWFSQFIIRFNSVGEGSV